MRLLIVFLLSVIVGFSVGGQEIATPEYAQGEVLLQLHKNQSLNNLLPEFNKNSVNKVDTISARFNIFLLHFNASRTAHRALINSFQQNHSVANVQNNHFISLRSTEETYPNDALYDQLWAMNNTGQNGGTPGADIDAQHAWDITTGGFTAHNDRIVVAIIDGGCDLNHQDLSFWKNINEIPNNGIDDDNNGFVDDFDGWNSQDHNGVISLDNHGTHVSGIAGAKGNNSVGVSGVNWNLNILPITGESTNEATVVEALAYVYVVREQYDNSGGQEGAFVVADNCSFGVNKGKPEDYPIWEAMYDSLGTLGILSVGATANNNWDIDKVGDIPTAFSTDFLISVTNTNNKDKLVSNAAYGDTTIDLSAPGQLILSTLINNKYGYLNGTSMSAPYVTGAVALMFAAADSEFITTYKANPDSLALVIKEYILNGTDPLGDLIGKTVSGGRLNLFNSLNILNDIPSLSVFPGLINIDVLKQNTKSDTLYIKNSGGNTFNYQIDLENNAAWLTLSSYQGSLASQEIDKIIMTFSGIGIDTGYYSNAIVVSGDDVETQTIPVEMHVYTDVGIEDKFYNGKTIEVFPNPFSESVNFIVEDVKKKTVTLTIFNQTGQSVFSTKDISICDKWNFTWIDKNLIKGIYYYQIIVDDRLVFTGKTLKH